MWVWRARIPSPQISNVRWNRTNSSILLRPYQEACIQSCLDAIQHGHTRIGVSSPTGSGKTTMFVSLIARLQPPEGKSDATRSLVIVNSVELVRQTAESVRRLFPNLTIEVEQGSKNNASGLADITVATYQTLLRPHRLDKFHPERMKAVIVDEAHHAAAPSYRRILSHFDPAIKSYESPQAEASTSSGVPIVGFSATFSRHDGIALGSVFERIVYHRDFLEMVDEKWLCPLRFTSVKADIDLSSVTINSRSGDFNATSLVHVINTASVNKLVLQTWLDRAATRKSTLVFCVNIAHVVELTNTFRRAGVDARYLHSKIAALERKILLDDFRAGNYPVLVNCAILTEGVDIPNVDCVIVARPTRSRNLFSQMIGRGMRLSPQTGKDDCHIVDFVDTLNRVDNVVSTPTLFGLDPGEEIVDKSLQELRLEQRDEGGAFTSVTPVYNIPLPKSITYEDHENPWSVSDNASGSPYIGKLSPYAWVACGRDTYVLECVKAGFIKIEPVPLTTVKSVGDPIYMAHFVPTLRESGLMIRVSASSEPPIGKAYLKKRKILTADSLESAVKGCDTYVARKVLPGAQVNMIMRTAKWRKDPATDGQKALLRKRLHLNDAPSSSSEATSSLGSPSSGRGHARKPISIDTITKGEAASLLTRLFHGAMGNFFSKMKATAKLEQNEVKERRKMEMKMVKVGPL